MKTKIVAGGIVIILLTGCITSTTTSSAKFEETDDAAMQNYNLGARYYQNGSFHIARERLERALELDPKLEQAHFMLALTYEQLDSTRLATEHYEEAVRIAPNSYDARNAYAVFLCRKQEYGDAEKQFDKLFKISDNDSRFVMYTNAGACMTQKPDYEKAEMYFRKALQDKPTHPEALIQLAAMKFKTKECLQSRAFLQRFLTSNKTSPGVLYLGMQIEECLEDERAATDYANQLLREFPKSPEARQVLAAD